MTLVVPVEDANVSFLRTTLARISEETFAQMRQDPGAAPTLAFHAVESLHYGRFFLAEASPEHGDPALLVFSTNYDGPLGEPDRDEPRARASHIADLVKHAYAGLDEVFRHCRGYEQGSTPEELERFLGADEHRIPAQTFYVGSSGRSRGQILEEWELRLAIEAAADRVAARRPAITDPNEVRQKICDELEAADVTIPPPFPPQPDGQAVVGLTFAALAGVVLGVFGGLVPFLVSLVPGVTASFGTLVIGGLVLLFALGLGLYGLLRAREENDPVDVPGHDAATTNHTLWASRGENTFMQNQLTHLVDVKDGLFRLALIKGVFWALQLLATYVYNRGRLGDIPSIHFARWVFLGNKRRVLFFSNFDNSWQSYLGDFIDQASSGLTGVWSNTKGYPRTKNLTDAGSRNSTSFLAWTRAHQLPTDVWFSAYPALSIKNVNDNTLLRRGVADPEAVSAQDWLHALAGEDLEPQQPSGKKDPLPPAVELPLHDVQGIILKGYGYLPHAAFVMLRVKDPEPARTWISSLPVTAASEAARQKRLEENHPELAFVNVAFTHAGLERLGVEEALLDSFPIEFVRGSHDPARSRILGDIGDNAPEHWDWGSDKEPVHVLLMLYCRSADRLAKVTAEYKAAAVKNGLEVFTVLDGHELPGRKEHFGFRDGISQPAIRDNPLDQERAKLRPLSRFNELAPGEFLLGYYNGYRMPGDTGSANVAFAPKAADGFEFAKGGSYLVFRQLEQDVGKFWRYCDRVGKTPGIDLSAEHLASKMVGRWPNGEPLAVAPSKPKHPNVLSNKDDFGYLKNDDGHGEKCPFGAHLRRTNPRDWLLGANPVESMRLSSLHRILRRGRPYGPAFAEGVTTENLIKAACADNDDDKPRGLNFICFNANIERQFEFVQQQWIDNAQLSQLTGDADPLMGQQHRPDAGTGAGAPGFTVQKDPLRGRCPGLQDFVHVRGSSYFFMPPLATVKYLGTL